VAVVAGVSCLSDWPFLDSAEHVDGQRMKSKWLSTEEIARELGLSPRTVRRHIQKGRLRARAYLVGGRATYRVQRPDLDAFLTRFARDTFEPD